MKFCKECGKGLPEGAEFCKECGTKVKADGEQTESSTSSSFRDARQSKQPMSKKSKMMLVIGGVVVAFLFGGYQAGAYLTSKDRLVEKFETAISEKDAKALSGVLSSNDAKLKIDEKSVKGMLAYFEEYPDEASYMLEHLKTQSKSFDQKGKVSEDEFSDINVVQLEKEGKSFVFDKYELNVNPVYLTVMTNYKDTVLFVDNKEVGKADKADFEKTVGPFLPGIHRLKATLKTDFMELEKKEEVSLAANSGTENYSINLEAEEVTVSLGGYDEETIPNVKYFINGKKVELEPAQHVSFGPVLTDGSMKLKLEAEMPWGTLKTNEIPIYSNYLEPNLANDSALQEELIKNVVLHAKERLEVLTSGDMKKFTTAGQEMVDELENIISENREYGLNYKGSYLGSIFDLDGFDLYQNGEKWKALVTVNEKYKGDEFYDDEKAEVVEYEEALTYDMTWDNKGKKWTVDGYEDAWSFEPENTKEMMEKDPKEVVTSWATVQEVSTDASVDSLDTSSVDTLISNYLYGLVAAINENDFSLVEPYLLPGSELYSAQKDLLKKANEKGFKESLLDYEITETIVEDGKAIISTWEQIDIMYSDGESETKEFNWTYEAVPDEEGNLLLSTIE